MNHKKQFLILLSLTVVIFSLSQNQEVFASSLTVPGSAGNNVIDYRDISVLGNFSASLTTDQEKYSPSETGIVTVVDNNANIDLSVAETITAQLGSQNIILTETGTNTGIFSGAFDPRRGELKYIGDHPDDIPRAHLDIDLATPGDITISDVILPNDGMGCPFGFEPALHGLRITLSNGATLASINSLTISYANAKLVGQDPAFLKMFYQDDPSNSYLMVAEYYDAIYNPDANNFGSMTLKTDPNILSIAQSSGAPYYYPNNLGTGIYVPALELGCGGGGGGGISRAGFVVQALGAIAVFGGSGIDSAGPPSFDPSSFTLIKDGTNISQDSSNSQSPLEVGKQSSISMNFRMPGGLGDLNHVGLYANLDKGQTKNDADTYIYFDKYNTPQLTVHDPHGFFKSVNVDSSEPSRGMVNVIFTFEFAKPTEKDSVVFEAWNNARESAQTEIPGLLEVIDNTPQPIVEEKPVQTAEQKQSVPDWVKSNAGWWGKGTIDDTTFTNSIGYLIEKNIIDVNVDSTNTSPDTLSETAQESVTPIVPDWVKNTALWWSEGQLTDGDFLTGIKYLVEKGIIQVKV